MFTRNRANQIIKFYGLPIEVTYVWHYVPGLAEYFRIKYKNVSFYLLIDAQISFCAVYEDINQTDPVINFNKFFEDAKKETPVLFQRMMEYWQETDKIPAIVFTIKNKKKLMKSRIKELDFRI
jgi:hypothetical protein